MNYITYGHLYQDVLALIPRLPKVRAVYGVPRSGMTPATILATELLLPLGMVGMEGLYAGLRGTSGSDGVALVVDDSVLTGQSMAVAREAMRDTPNVVYATIYMQPGFEDHVDLFGRLLPTPRIFQWNLFNSWATERGMWDLDGVFCRDPEPFDDDGPEYEAALRDAVPLHLPRKAVGCIVTNRIERWRGVTEDWLARHGIAHHHLVMQPFGTAAERRAKSDPAAYKAEWMLKSNAPLFVESHDHIARGIAALAKRPVLSLESETVF